MQKSRNLEVQKMLDDLKAFDHKKYLIMERLRQMVFVQYPKTDERLMYGGIMFSLQEDFGGIFVSKNHVSFEFGSGYKMLDPNGMLEGVGKLRRHLKIKYISDINTKNLAFFIAQAV